MGFLWAHGKTEAAGAVPEAREIIEWLRGEIRRQENLLYGVALFFECLNVLYAGQDAVLETYRRQLRNIIRLGRNDVEQANRLLAEAEQDPAKAVSLVQFEFSFDQNQPDLQRIVRRAAVLADAYERVFPGRPRSQTFAPEETFRLIEQASLRVDEVEG